MIYLASYDYLMGIVVKTEALNNKTEHKSILTNREIEYLALVALGYKNNIVAKSLSVSQSTVKKTLEKIFKKLNAKDRTNAVAIAFTHNFLSNEMLLNFKEKYNL